MLSDSLLSVRMKHRLGALVIDVTYESVAPWTVLFGPSGSGKTSVLRAIAGFIRPNEGRVEINGTVIFDSSIKKSLPAYQRPVRGASQSAKLFPNYTVRDNVLYGCGRPLAADVRDIADQAMTAFHVDHLSHKRPQDLSGGEAQRVAVCRALVSASTFNGPGSPLLLLDEPLSGLDITTRDQVTTELIQWTQKWKIPVLSVTHNIGEAFRLDAYIVKMASGKVVEQGAARDVLKMERDRLLNQLEKN
jgi:molybdate transport system ATP-binding protein